MRNKKWIQKCYQGIMFRQTYNSLDREMDKNIFLNPIQIYGLTQISIKISKPCDTNQDELAKLFHQCIKNDFRYFLCTTTYCPLGIHNDDSCKTNWFPSTFFFFYWAKYFFYAKQQISITGCMCYDQPVHPCV